MKTMKGTLILVIIAAMSFVMAVMITAPFCKASAAQIRKRQYQTAYDLWQTWKQNGKYPDWFCGAWTEQNLFYMGILEVSENAKEQVLNSIADKTSVTFVNQKYSYNALVNIKSAIVPEEAANGVVAAEIDERNNCLDVALFAYMTENERAVCRRNLESKYSDRISIDDEAYLTNRLWHGISKDPAESSFSEDAGTIRILRTTGRNLWLGIGVIIAVMALGYAMYLRNPVRYTTDGRSVAKRGKVTNEDIVRFIKESGLTTSGRLDEAVANDIEKYMRTAGKGSED